MPLQLQSSNRNSENYFFEVIVVGFVTAALLYLFNLITNRKTRAVNQHTQQDRFHAKNLISTDTGFLALEEHPENSEIEFTLEENGTCSYYRAGTYELLATKEKGSDEDYIDVNDLHAIITQAPYVHLPCELYELQTDQLSSYAQMVAVIMDKKYLTHVDGHYEISTYAPTLANQVLNWRKKPLSQAQAFYNQYAIGAGTAFLGASNRIITAGHCVEGINIQQYHIVFNFHCISPTETKTSFHESEVYSMQKIVDHKCNSEEDWAVVQLDRTVSGNRPIAKRSTTPPRKNTSLFTLGHPCGLPLKTDVAARVLQEIPTDNTTTARNRYVFFANLNTFCGNSGSPVFNATTGEIEGILVKGQADFEEQNGEMVFKVHSPGSEGEGCTVISRVEAALLRP